MEVNATQQQSIREYLLGRLPREEQTQFEERLFTDDDFYQELGILENELVDEYLRGELTTTDRESFESHFVLAPEHQEKLNFARTFSTYLAANPVQTQDSASAAQSPEPQTAVTPARTDRSRSRKLWFGFLPLPSPAFGYAVYAVLLVMGVGATWAVWRNVTMPRDPGRIMAFELTPGLTRSEDEAANRVVVPANIDTIRLQLILSDNGYESYEATLSDSDNRTLATQNLKAVSIDGQPSLNFDVASSDVSSGDYRIKTVGITKDARENLLTYPFSIHKQ